MKRVFLVSLACSVLWQVYTYTTPVQVASKTRGVRAWQQGTGSKPNPLPVLWRAAGASVEREQSKVQATLSAPYVSTLDARIRRADSVRLYSGQRDSSVNVSSGTLVAPQYKTGKVRKDSVRKDSVRKDSVTRVLPLLSAGKRHR